MKVVKVYRTAYGRTVIPKKQAEKGVTLDALLAARKIDMTAAEREVVDRYLSGAISRETLETELMNLPIE